MFFFFVSKLLNLMYAYFPKFVVNDNARDDNSKLRECFEKIVLLNEICVQFWLFGSFGL